MHGYLQVIDVKIIMEVDKVGLYIGSVKSLQWQQNNCKQKEVVLLYDLELVEYSALNTNWHQVWMGATYIKGLSLFSKLIQLFTVV